MAKRDTEAYVEFECTENSCLEGEDYGPETFIVEGHWNAEGEFVALDPADLLCPQCDAEGTPTDSDIVVLVERALLLRTTDDTETY